MATCWSECTLSLRLSGQTASRHGILSSLVQVAWYLLSYSSYSSHACPLHFCHARALEGVAASQLPVRPLGFDFCRLLDCREVSRGGDPSSSLAWCYLAFPAETAPSRRRGTHARPFDTSIKSHFCKISSTFGDKCPQNGSKYGSMAPSTGLGYHHEGPSVEK
jgi:hypothetical protein